MHPAMSTSFDWKINDKLVRRLRNNLYLGIFKSRVARGFYITVRLALLVHLHVTHLHVIQVMMTGFLTLDLLRFR
jgi:hypothetical protein